MKQAVIAAALSIALHVGGVLLFLSEAAPTVAAVARPREKAVQIEVLRTGLVSASPKKSAAPTAVAPTPVPRPAARPAASGGSIAAAPAVSPAAAVSPAPGVWPARMGKGTPSDIARSASPVEAASPGPEANSGDGAPIDTTALSRRLQQVALRCYPAAARRFRQTGEAQIRFCVDPAGALREVTVVRSTSSELLDHAAIDCVVPGAAPFGPETFGRCFTVPVRFNP